MRWVISGADKNTGQDRQVTIEADDKVAATRIAVQQGIFVADVQFDSPETTVNALNDLAAIVQKTDTKNPSVMSYADSTVKRRSGRLARYRHRVGHRSFIFQIVLMLWTLMYLIWLISLFVAAGAYTSSGPRFPGMITAPPPSVSFADIAGLFAGLMSGWMGFCAGWAIVGLPLGIAAIAVMENNKT